MKNGVYVIRKNLMMKVMVAVVWIFFFKGVLIGVVVYFGYGNFLNGCIWYNDDC